MSAQAVVEAAPDEVDVRWASAPAWRRIYQEHMRLIMGVLGILSVLVPWELLSRLGIVKKVLISSPTGVVQAAFTDVGTGTIWGDLTATLTVFVLGFTAASVVGILVGLAAGWFRRASYIARPWLNVLYTAPEIAFVPMFILWFGLGLTFKVWLVFLSAVFFIALNTMAGVLSTEERFLNVAHTFGANRMIIFRTIVLPGSVPYIVTGLRQGAGRAIIAVVVAEFVSSNQGIGFMITIAGSTLNTSRVMFGIVILAALGVLIGEILRRVEARFEVWRVETGRA